MHGFRNALFCVLAVLVGCDGSPSVPPSTAQLDPSSSTPTTQSLRWTAGKEFVVLSTAAPTTFHEEVTVTEVFWYGCPHCYTFEPHLTLWLLKVKAANVNFVRVPAVWGIREKQHARLFYTLEELGLQDLHHEVFDAIHRKGNKLCDPKSDNNAFASQLAFVKTFGVDEALFRRTHYSQGIDARLVEAEHLAKTYRVDALPTIVVNGKYKSDLIRNRGHANDLIELTQHLVSLKPSTP